MLQILVGVVEVFSYHLISPHLSLDLSLDHPLDLIPEHITLRMTGTVLTPRASHHIICSVHHTITLLIINPVRGARGEERVVCI